MSKADSPTKKCQPCMESGEVRPMRAHVDRVPMCSRHYNRTRYAGQERHPKHPATCVVCGKQWKASRRDAKLCSDACRAIEYARQREPLSCSVPWRTCPDCGVAWFRCGSKALQCDPCGQQERERREAARRLRLAEVDRQMQPRSCDDCGRVYTPGTTIQRYCSTYCSARVQRRERKAREHGAQGSFTWTQVISLFLLFDRRCAYCDVLIEGQPDPDHVVPLAGGGHNGIGNILPACRACNCDKRDVPLHEWNEDRARRGLPSRRTTWDASDPRYRHLTVRAAGHAELLVTLTA